MTADQISLHEHLTVLIKSLERHVDAQFKAIEDARGIAFCAMEKRLDEMNEFRGQLRDQAAGFMTKSMFDLRHEALQREIDTRNAVVAADLESLKLSRALMESKASQKSVNIALFFSLIGAAAGVVAIIKLFL